MSKPVRIALRLPNFSYAGRVLIGVLHAAHARGWIVSTGENSPEFMLKHGMRGIIGGPDDIPAPACYKYVGIKYVGMLGYQSEGCTAAVQIGHAATGTVAGEHLLEAGFRDFGHVGYPGHGVARRQGFEEAVRGRARSLSICPVTYHKTPEDFEVMLNWLRGLPKPVGIFAADDAVGSSVTEVCHLGGIRVPADVAVVAVNDDGIHTVASEPELSSVKIPWEVIGVEAVKCLAAHMDDDPSAPTSVVVGPSGIAVRASSDINVIGDTEVAAASAFIRQNLSRGIGVRDVAESTTISRRLLERRFKRETGRTVLEQIQFVRMEKARKMLVETTLRVNDIAKACGFGSRSQFHRVFQKAVGVTPDEHRKRGEASIRTNRDSSEGATGQANTTWAKRLA